MHYIQNVCTFGLNGYRNVLAMPWNSLQAHTMNQIWLYHMHRSTTIAGHMFKAENQRHNYRMYLVLWGRTSPSRSLCCDRAPLWVWPAVSPLSGTWGAVVESGKSELLGNGVRKSLLGFGPAFGSGPYPRWAPEDNL